tara:strand:+ start:750 stop:1100 length:351 start_codon:yes stop_codon:yes gene_type:complete
MCIRCHSGLSDTKVLEDLTNALKTKQYEIFNKTSINHILFAALNYNGEQTKKIAIELLEEYNEWAKINNPKCFGFNLTEIIKQIYKVNYTQEEIIDDINHCNGTKLYAIFENNYTE